MFVPGLKVKAMNYVFGWFMKHFEMLLAVYILMSSIGLDMHVQVH